MKVASWLQQASGSNSRANVEVWYKRLCSLSLSLFVFRVCVGGWCPVKWNKIKFNMFPTIDGSGSMKFRYGEDFAI